MRALARERFFGEVVGNVVVVGDARVVVARETAVGVGLLAAASAYPVRAHQSSGVSPGRGTMPATRTSPDTGRRSATSGAVKRAEGLRDDDDVVVATELRRGCDDRSA